MSNRIVRIKVNLSVIQQQLEREEETVEIGQGATFSVSGVCLSVDMPQLQHLGYWNLHEYNTLAASQST